MIPEGTPKPGAQMVRETPQTPLVKKILYQRERNNHFGIYEYIQVDLAYSSSRMASNRLTRQQVEEIYRTNRITPSFEAPKVDDIVHFEVADATRFHWGGMYGRVVTNPPYMGSSCMDQQLSGFVRKYYPDSKSDLFAAFMERCAGLTARNGCFAMITQHSWMFLSSYEKLASLKPVFKKDGTVTDHCDPYGYHAELRPDTASKIFDMNRYKFRDSKWMSKRGDFHNKPILRNLL